MTNMLLLECVLLLIIFISSYIHSLTASLPALTVLIVLFFRLYNAILLLTVDHDFGFCYVHAFKRFGWVVGVLLGRYPSSKCFAFLLCRTWLWYDLDPAKQFVCHGGKWHVMQGYVQGTADGDCSEGVIGASWQDGFADFQAEVQATGRVGARFVRGVGPYNQHKSNVDRFSSNLRAEMPSVPSVRMPVVVANRRAGEQEAEVGHRFQRQMDKVSAMEAAKVLLSGMDALGSVADRIALAQEAFSEGLTTTVPPSSPNYARLTKLLGPLKYSPGIAAHPEASTIRKAAMDHASVTNQGAVVGLCSPSKQELHAFPNAVVWEFTDGMDKSRRAKACSRCKAPECAELERMRRAGRVLAAAEWQRAAAHFKKFGVTVLVLMNIEPNISAVDLTRMMVRSEVYSALSLFTVDWRALLGQAAIDTLIGMETQVSFGKVVSSFADGGDYVQSMTNVRQLFAPTFADGCSLRRTTIFSEGASTYQELTLVEGGWATRNVPNVNRYYFIKVIMPDSTRPVLCLERTGLDRLLATYRTQAIKDKDVARIVLRQSVVTYSISGTQVTPRIAITQSQSEALAVWLEVYSEVQDRNAVAQADRMRPQTAYKAARAGVFGAVASTLQSSAPGVMALSSASSVDAFLRIYRSEFGEMTLEQMSQRALEEHFGTKIEPESLLNVVVSAWQQLYSWVSSPNKWLKRIDGLIHDGWAVTFSMVDVLAVMSCLGVQYSLNGVNVVLDCIMMAARVSGRMDVLQNVSRFARATQWSVDKAKVFWVTVQDAQSLDFQAATIDIVETAFNLFSRDPAAELQAIREKNVVPEETLRELELNAGLPFSDFLSEIKLFLGKFNSHLARSQMAATLLNAFHHDCRRIPESSRAKLVHVLKESAKLSSAVNVRELGWALDGSEPDCKPLPVKPINQQDIRECFDRGRLLLPSPNGEVVVQRLDWVDGKVDCSPIHAIMDLQHGDVVRPENFGKVNYISPDARGASRQQMLVEYAKNQPPAIFSRRANVTQWYNMTMQNGVGLKQVDDILRAQASLFEMESIPKWIAHVTGLAMGGKSKGFESWITANDLVVVPTNDLKADWQANLGKLDPVRRAPVVTQHNALQVKYAARYVIIDECYAFDPEHLQAIANRHERCQGIITIGDRRQISNVFSPTQDRLNIDDVPCRMMTPTTFLPWDAACVYLNTTTTDMHVDSLFVAGRHAEGLQYTLTADGTLMPGEGDLAIQGTQAAKEVACGRGLDAHTSHECQGRRSDNTVVHVLGTTLRGDIRWLSHADRAAHLGVTISRARKRTIFVADALRDLAAMQWLDDALINGLSSQVIYGGTAWDLVEPRSENESTWEHLFEKPLRETTVTEIPLTDPVTIGTVMVNGEHVSRNEIVTNVELVDGVTFTDVGRPIPDDFDNYCFQPRDVPGVDEQQALTRAGVDEPATANDEENAARIVELLFEEVVDKKMFFAHLNNSRRAALSRQTRQQAIDGAYARTETRASAYSYAFLKPEFAKKESVLPGELKAQGVVTASEMQQAMFADVCDALTHAWARSQQPGKLSPVGLVEEEVEGFLATFEHSYELDIEKQDSSHKAVHIMVASLFIDMAADRLGLGDMAKELRYKRTVRMMGTMFKFVLQKSLASGDPWTLIINKIMAWSSLVSVARVKDVRACQSGDDITLDQEPPWRVESLRDQIMGNVGVVWKSEEREQRQSGVTFISRAALPGGRIVYKALRTVLKYMVRKRNQIQHAGIKADAGRIDRLASKHGLQAYAEDRALVWGGDPVVIFDLWTRALAVARTPFAELPSHLRSEEPRQYTIKSRNGGCFGYALAHCVRTNVEAINAIAMYPVAVSQTTALHACREAGVKLLIMNEKWANRSRLRLQDAMDKRKLQRAFVVAYDDHAVAVVPNTLTLHGALGKRTISWNFTDSKEVMITDFD